MTNTSKNLTLSQVKKQARLHKEKNTVVETTQLIVFELGGEEFAFPIDQVKEIVHTPGVAKIPQTPSYIKGVSNIRGTIIALIDLEQKFKLLKDARAFSNFKYTLVIESESHKIGILVQDVPSTLTIPVDSIDTSKDVLQYSSLDEDSIDGIAKIDDRLIMLVNILHMISSESFELPKV